MKEYQNMNTARRAPGATGEGGGAVAIDGGAARSGGEALTVATFGNQRRDRTGAAMLSSRSVLLLMRLAVTDSECTWGTMLKVFRQTFGITDEDLVPLVEAGWVARRGAHGAVKVSMTDRGNEVVRGLIAWMGLQSEGGAA